MVVAVLGAALGTAAADRHQVTGASFEAAPNWEAQDAPDHSTLVYRQGTTFGIFVVYTPHPGALAASFDADWKRTTVNTPTRTVPKPTSRKLGARNLLEGSADTTTEGSNVTMNVILVEANGQIVDALVYTQNRAMLKALQPDIDKMLGSLQVAAPAAAPEPVAAPAPVATGAARVLTTIALKDLAGAWSTHDQAVTTYVNSSSGAYAGTQTSATQDFYDIKADGTYAHRFQGLANGHVVRESSKGTVSLAGDAIVFTGSDGDVHRFHFLEFAIDADGTSHWKVLDAQYPINSANIGLYAEKWVRVVAKK
jgi:hypothetical protein